MTDVVIETRGLTKRYGADVVVDGVDLTVYRGETFGVLGPNGAGKTTTILMLLGLSDVSSGSARILGLDPARATLAVKSKVGYLPDAVGFYDNLTAAENLRYTAKLMRIPHDERAHRIVSALSRVRLLDAANKPVSTFSRGMRQRLGLADLLMKRAEIVILDEPTSGLDPHATTELLGIIRSLKEDGVTVLLSSHLLDQVQSICDRVALFHRGRIALIGTVPDLAQHVLGGGYTVEIEAQGGDLVRHLQAIPGVHAVEQTGLGKFRLLTDRDLRAEAAAAVVVAGGKLTALSVEGASLQSIYTRYFQSDRRTELSDAA